MATSQAKSILYEVLRGEPIPRRTLTYFRRRLSNRLHALVLEEFARLEAEKKITKADLARRIDRAPELISRWLGGPGNWTADTLSDLMLGMGCEPDFSVKHLRQATATQDIRASLRAVQFVKHEAETEEKPKVPSEPKSAMTAPQEQNAKTSVLQGEGDSIRAALMRCDQSPPRVGAALTPTPFARAA